MRGEGLGKIRWRELMLESNVLDVGRRSCSWKQSDFLLIHNLPAMASTVNALQLRRGNYQGELLDRLRGAFLSHISEHLGHGFRHRVGED
jgi:hypothetical protein